MQDTLRLIQDLSVATLLWPYQPISATFEDLKSTGNLQVLGSVDIRRAIADYYNVRWENFDV